MAVPGRFRHRGAPRCVAPLLLALIATAIAASPATALVVKTWNGPGTPAVINNSAPADDPGWNNVGEISNGVYLGNQWVITAAHAGTGRFRTPLGSFEQIPGTEVRLTNPAQFSFRSNLDEESDILMYRIGLDETTGLTPEELGMGPIGLATTLPGQDTDADGGDELTMIGGGFRRQVNSANSEGQWHFRPKDGGGFTSTTNLAEATEHGFFRTQQREMIWGTNRRADPSGVSATRSGGRILIESSFNDTVGFVTRFDRGLDHLGNPNPDDGSTPDEAQATANDSGGGVFVKENGEWVLAGLMHAVYFTEDEGANLILFGQHTAISDLSDSHYRSQVEGNLASSVFSEMGDIDLDGSVTGGIVGDVATGDLAVLVDNWGYAAPEADLKSWVRGDLNQDGVTNLLDFTLLRGALGDGGGVTVTESQFLALVTPVPEPSTALLAAVGAIAFRRRSR